MPRLLHRLYTAFVVTKSRLEIFLPYRSYVIVFALNTVSNIWFRRAFLFILVYVTFVLRAVFIFFLKIFFFSPMPSADFACVCTV